MWDFGSELLWCCRNVSQQAEGEEEKEEAGGVYVEVLVDAQRALVLAIPAGALAPQSASHQPVAQPRDRHPAASEEEEHEVGRRRIVGRRWVRHRVAGLEKEESGEDEVHSVQVRLLVGTLGAPLAGTLLASHQVLACFPPL
jgi:hypothetical protein